MAKTRKSKRKAEDAVSDDERETGQLPKPIATEKHPETDDEGTNQEINVKHFTIPYKDKQIPCERRGEVDNPALIWTHGAGGGLAAPAASEFADGFSEYSSIVSFQGSMNLPSRVKMFHPVIEHEDFDAALGGRSMGSRAAVMAAMQQDCKTKALVLVSFPLVGGKKNDSREQTLLHLPKDIDVLLISGDRDSMCDLEQLREVIERMKAKCWLVTVQGADHGMGWSPKGTVTAMRRKTGAVAAEWLKGRDAEKRYSSLSWVRDGKAGEMVYTDWLASLPAQAEAKEDDAQPSKTDLEAPEHDTPPPARKRKRGKT
ncbi:hypothetical protein LTR35_012491 [Friedmanniomyces endolithicus]|uniref:KANL3/Tex30 alpha/beta hydrolase-like domain-containing protein n=1 Tax=Friedmanniomyces endolithicus TaxID=329885 RepID=A0AAN6JDF3_9PEZI|nr:hypothetical protein LTR35_012491 [Friedmanniomyces endolithicus]KAK0294643.1 hypothetical protein LTS00_006844 [Friedmanniomyces endolithicus]KAK0325974.1 hypothetical protein LTR82_002719 [Friedmanniomyces endolithicus]KAK1009750.1 hypothetical protein LTR54_005546 [Friedmanniomyces endolithicus]